MLAATPSPPPSHGSSTSAASALGPARPPPGAPFRAAKSASHTLARLLSQPAQRCDWALATASGRTRPVVRAAVAASSEVLAREARERPAVAAVVGVGEALLDCLVGVLHGEFGGLEQVETEALWELVVGLRELVVVGWVVGVVEREIEGRDDAVDVDGVWGAFEDGEGRVLSGGMRARRLAGRRYVRERFCELCRGEEWGRLGVETVEKVLRLNDLRLPGGELDAFRALLSWARVPGNAHGDAVRLLRVVRFPTMSDADLLTAVRCDVFAGDDVFYRMVLEAFVRRAEVRLLHMPRNAARREREGAPKYGSAVSEALLIHRVSPNAPVSSARLNARGVRTAAFKGGFPLPLYRHMRFRKRSEGGLLFTAVLPGWRAARQRIRTESRSFLDHKWSIWIDPKVVVDGEGGRAGEEGDNGAAGRVNNMSINANTIGNTTNISTATTGRSEEQGFGDDDDDDDERGYMSMYLCCHSDLGDADRTVSVTVDYSLFVASAADPFVMERKVCPAKSFTTHGQASGFRLHTRRALLTRAEPGLYDAANDELVVGAHIVALSSAPNPDVLDDPADAETRAEPPTQDAVGTAYELQQEARARRSKSLPSVEARRDGHGGGGGDAGGAGGDGGRGGVARFPHSPSFRQRYAGTAPHPGPALGQQQQHARLAGDASRRTVPAPLEREPTPPMSPGAGSTMSSG